MRFIFEEEISIINGNGSGFYNEIAFASKEKALEHYYSRNLNELGSFRGYPFMTVDEYYRGTLRPSCAALRCEVFAVGVLYCSFTSSSTSFRVPVTGADYEDLFEGLSNTEIENKIRYQSWT